MNTTLSIVFKPLLVWIQMWLRYWNSISLIYLLSKLSTRKDDPIEWSWWIYLNILDLNNTQISENLLYDNKNSDKWNNTGIMTDNFTIKVSEYPFKQNINMLKSMTVLLQTYFYYISLNVLRLTFFNIYNLPFLHSPNIGKIRVKVGPNTKYFSYFWAPAPTKLQFQ